MTMRFGAPTRRGVSAIFQRTPDRPSAFARVLSYIVLFGWSAVVLFPIYWVAVTSLKTPIDVASGPKYLPFIDFQPTLEPWRYILVEQWSDTVRPFLNSIVVSFSSSVLALVAGTMAGYALARIAFRPSLEAVGLFVACTLLAAAMAVALGVAWPIAAASGLSIFILIYASLRHRFKLRLSNKDIALWIISQRALPPVSIVIPLYVMFLDLGILATPIPLILTYAVVNLPIVVWLSRDFVARVPYEIEESAIVDGASRYRIFWSIILPTIKPGLAAIFLLVLILSWNEYLLALILSTGDTQTMPLLVAAQNATRGPQWWTMSALILIMIVPVFVMAIILERFIRRGFLSGALKG